MDGCLVLPFCPRVQILANTASMVGCPNSGARRRTQHLGYILSMDLASTTEDYGPLLGFLAALSRSQTDWNLESEYRTATAPGRIVDCTSCASCIVRWGLGVV